MIRSSSLKQAGFTLIELLVVIAIIGILASIILASLSTSQAKGRDARRVSDIKQIELALGLYYDANSYYPLTIYGAPSVLVSGGFISSVPYDPNQKGGVCTDGSQADCYSYAALGSGATNPISYHLGVSLETSNNALSSDSDTCTGGTAGTACPTPNTNDVYAGPVVTGSAGDFSGLGIKAGGGPCGGSVGTQAPGTEMCYDVTP